VIDDSETNAAAGSGAPTLDPPKASIDADTPSWKGILVRQLSFYLPSTFPLFGGRPIHGYFEIPYNHGGIRLVASSKVSPQAATADHPSRSGYSIRIECIDPTAKGLAGIIPTLISATMELPLDGSKDKFKDKFGTTHEITFGGGKPILLTATFARDPVNQPESIKISVGASSQGKKGILSVDASSSGGAKIFNTVASMATALIADGKVDTETEVGNTPGVVLYSLLAAGTALSSLFEDDSSHFVLHGVEIESTGHGAPMIGGGGKVTVTIDYSVALRVKGISVGALFVEMLPDQPMRIRIRKAKLSVDPAKSGLSMIGLDFERAQMEVENPGAWKIQGLDSLFDVIGSRSGRGSSWVEVDLRFKINLGPIKVSGATIRATLEDNGSISATIRGLKVDLNIPGAMDGSGQLQLIQGGFSADLRANIIPLNLGADAGIIYAPPMVVLRLGVDLPAPIPLANTGFGLFGIGGMFGISAKPNYGSDEFMDPVLRQLKWTPDSKDKFKEARGQFTFGLSAAVGTFPDLGFSFSSKAGILLTIPDISIRGSLNGRVIQPPVKLSDPSYPPSPGISFLGFIGIDEESLSFGLIGSINLRPLLDIKVPLAGHFPFGENSDNWYVYLGADGYDGQGRNLGPVCARVLPDLLNLGADAYVMMRGRGIENWPYNRQMPSLTIMDGLVVAFGFGLQNTFGPKPIVWADIFASIDVLVGGSSPTLAGFGRAGGSLNLGPFSLGVESRVNVIISEASKYFWAEVTGRIKLLFVTIRGKVTISIGGKPNLELPYPEVHPLDILDNEGYKKGILGCVTDDTYRVVTPLMEDPAMVTDNMRVWPDAIISIPFAFPVDVSSGAFSQFPSVNGINAPNGSYKIGNEMLYYVWRLESLKLVDVTDEPDPFIDKLGISGQFSAKWQIPRMLSDDSNSSGNSDTIELLLFSTSENLWVNRLADGGKSNPGHPLENSAKICRQKVFAMTGWAIGFKARELEKGFCLPQDFLFKGKYASNFEVYIHHKGITNEGLSYSLDDTFTLPIPFSLRSALLVKWHEPKEIKHLFFGHLNLPCLQWISGRDNGEILNGNFKIIGQQIDLDLSEPLVDVMLILVADERSFFAGERFVGIHIFDNLGEIWTEHDTVSLPTGENGVLFRSPHNNPIIQISVTFPIGKSLGIVGVGGIAVRSIDAAQKANQHISDEIDRLSKASNDGPKTDPAINTAHQRNILEPGRTYRIDVNMVWAGEMSRQKEDGQTEIIPEDPANIKNKNEYKPKGIIGANPSTNKKLFFKTAKKAESQPQKKYGDYIDITNNYATWLYSKQDIFHPEMIERYLAGYDPAQSQEFYFRSDPLRVHFLQDHVAALAKAYGFYLKIKVERVDKPRSISPPLLLNPKWSFITDPLYLNKTDQLRYDYAVTSNCILPKPGATAIVNPELDPEALYDIHILAEPENSAAFNSCRLRGVTFKTSRWRNPSEMLNGLGFKVMGSSIQPDPVISGDLAINKNAFSAPYIHENNDQVFEDALLKLGLQGWPIARSQRLSRLWIYDDEEDRWLFAGLMIESSEPIYRKGRLDISLESLKVTTNPVGIPIPFDVYISDLSGFRILYLTTMPIQLDDPNTTGISTNVELTMKSTVHDTVTAANVITEIHGILPLIPKPSFSEDPA
jgi:hypothetical protein